VVIAVSGVRKGAASAHPATVLSKMKTPLFSRAAKCRNHRGMNNSRAFAIAVVLGAALVGQSPQIAGITAAAEKLVADGGLRGAALAVVRDGKVVHRSEHGRLRAGQVIPIASASKWLAVATVMSLVDDGTIDLDRTLGRYLPVFDRPDKRAITLRQCLSCTAGLPARDPEGNDRTATMASVAAAIAGAPLHANPGTEFLYGGATFQVVACAAEAATGKTFHQLFQERIAAPLELTATKFGRLLPPGAEPGTAAVPWVAGGAVSTLDEYARFVAMLAGEGEYGGVRVLKAASVRAMVSAQHGQTHVRMPGLGDGDLGYGLGTWIQALDDKGARRVSDPGAFGFTPWLDLDLGVGAVLAVRDRLGRVLPHLPPLQDSVHAAMQQTPQVGSNATVTLQHGGRDRSYLLHVPPQMATSKQRLPLVVVFHGGGGNGEQVAHSTGFSALADREGFVVVYPNGTGRLRGKLLTWNSGGIEVYAADEKVDDVGFVEAVVADVLTKVAVDPQRVYATGMSNGAMLCHRLAREAAETFAAIAPVSGAMDFTEKDAPTHIGVMIVHGTADEHVRYDGGRPGKALGRAGDRVDASVADARDYYLQRNGLSSTARVETDGRARIEIWERSAEGTTSPFPVRVVTLQGGGHAWPGGAAGEMPDADTPVDWAASRAIWAFFAPIKRP
jgi:polyhydroxybutyrate depolymerase